MGLFEKTYLSLMERAKLLGSRPYFPIYTAQGYNKKATPFCFPNQIITNSPTHQGQTTLIGSNVSNLILIHCKDNHNKSAPLKDYSFTIDISDNNDSGEVVFQILGVGSVTGTPTFSDMNPNSVMEYELNSTVTLNNPMVVKEDVISYASSNQSTTVGKSSNVNLAELGLIARKGDYFAIVAKDLNSNGVTVRFTLNWIEESK